MSEVANNEWNDLVWRRTKVARGNRARRELRRQMYSELGFQFMDCGPYFGDVCLGMSRLSPMEVQVFNDELERRYKMYIAEIERMNNAKTQ